MDKFFTVLKENGLIMNFVFFCVCFLIIGDRFEHFRSGQFY